MKTFLFCILILIIVGGGLVSTGYAQPKYGGTFTNIFSRMPRQFGYTPTFAAAEVGPAYPCVEPLIKSDRKGAPTPHLATDWKIASDGSAITLSLRKGVKFQDGTDFNAEAVKYNLDLVMKERPGELLGVNSIEVIDEYTVRLNLDFFANNIWSRLGSRILISSPAHLAKGEDAVKFHPLGTGPFIFKDFERDVFVSYTRNDNYWQKGKPYLDSMKTIWIADPVTAAASFRAGEADAFRVGREHKEADDLKKKGFIANAIPSLLMGLAPDTKNPESIYNDIRVRKAIEYAIDRKALTEAFGYGFLKPRPLFSPPGSPGYIDGLEREYNPEKARQLLKEAGYPNGFKTTLIADVVFVSNDMMATMQAYLSDVGIKAKVDFADPGRYADWRRRTGWKGALMFMRNGLMPWIPDLMAFILDADRNDYSSMQRPEGFQKALKEVLAAQDPETLTKRAEKANRMLFDHATFVPLYSWPQVVLTAPYVRDHGICQTTAVDWTPENLWVDK